MYIWVALQMHRILQGYSELDSIAQPIVSSVVVGHLIKTRVPMAMRESLKTELTSIKSSVKAQDNTVEKLESKSGRQTMDILNLQQEMRTALKK
jgi:hypothetical protein